MATMNDVGVGLKGASGTGNFAGTTSPSFTTPALGTPSAGVLSSCTGYAQSALTGLGTGVSTALAANVTGSGGIALATSPTFVTPVLGAATATSLTFGGSVMSTYVTGTWTPVFTSSGGGTATYSAQQASYTQIGNRVMYDVFISLTGLPSAGNVTITGLPVNAASTSAVAVITTGLNAAVVSPITGYIIAGSSPVISLFTFTTGSITPLTVGGCSNTSTIILSGSYNVA